MNKYQKALNNIESGYVYHQRDAYDDDFELLQQLVDKETPIKPTNQVVIDFGLGNAGNCKACNREVNYQNKYCDNCGQRIDWREEA